MPPKPAVDRASSKAGPGGVSPRQKTAHHRGLDLARRRISSHGECQESHFPYHPNFRQPTPSLLQPRAGGHLQTKSPSHGVRGAPSRWHGATRTRHHMLMAPGAGRVCGVPAVVGEAASVSWPLLEGHLTELDYPPEGWGWGPVGLSDGVVQVRPSLRACGVWERYAGWCSWAGASGKLDMAVSSRKSPAATLVHTPS